VQTARDRVERSLAIWDGLLADLGGDPSFKDWRSFRPLRLTREEDWSDWLAHLIQSSATGYFAHHLLGSAAARAAPAMSPTETRMFVAPPRCDREVDTEDGRRADIVIRWAGDDSRWTHIEVKVGDEQFAKTYDTARKLRAKLAPAGAWTDFILIPQHSNLTWLECKDDIEGKSDQCPIAVCTLTWGHVASSLRASLIAKGENFPWRVWAYSFCGAVEQVLLGVPRQKSGHRTNSVADLGWLLSFADVLAGEQP